LELDQHMSTKEPFLGAETWGPISRLEQRGVKLYPLPQHAKIEEGFEDANIIQHTSSFMVYVVVEMS
jgi:hypothetical protein